MVVSLKAIILEVRHYIHSQLDRVLKRTEWGSGAGCWQGLSWDLLAPRWRGNQGESVGWLPEPPG